MEDSTEDIIKSFTLEQSPEIKPKPKSKTSDLTDIVYAMDDDLIKMKKFTIFDDKYDQNISDSEHDLTPIKRKRQSAQSAPPPPATKFSSSIPQKPTLLPKKLATSPTKNYTDHINQLRSGPNSPKKYQDDENIRSLKYEIKRLKQEQNLKLENLQHKIDYLTNERDELQNQLTSMSFENDKLTKKNRSLSHENNHLTLENSKLKTKEYSNEELQLENNKLQRVNSTLRNERDELVNDFNITRDKLKKYYDLYLHCQKAHAKEMKKRIEVDGDKPISDKPMADNSTNQELVDVLKKLSEMMIEQKKILEPSAAVEKDTTSEDKTPPIPNTANSSDTPRMVSDFLEDFIKRVFEEMLSNNKNTLSPKQAINSQTYSQPNNFSNNTVPPSQSAAYNPSNSQPAPPPQPATNFYSSSTPNANGYNQSLQSDERPETFELPHIAKDHWPQRPTSERSTQSTKYMKMDPEDIRKLVLVITDQLKKEQKSEKPSNVVEMETPVEKCQCCHGNPRNVTDTNNNQKLCQSCLNKGDFTMSEFMGRSN